MKRRTSFKSRIWLLAGVFVILVLAVAGCRNAGKWLVKSDDPPHADVMIVLMGDISDRVLQAADLYQERVSTKIWIVESSFTDYHRELESRGVHLRGNTEEALMALI